MYESSQLSSQAVRTELVKIMVYSAVGSPRTPTDKSRKTLGLDHGVYNFDRLELLFYGVHYLHLTLTTGDGFVGRKIEVRGKRRRRGPQLMASAHGRRHWHLGSSVAAAALRLASLFLLSPRSGLLGSSSLKASSSVRCVNDGQRSLDWPCHAWWRADSVILTACYRPLAIHRQPVFANCSQFAGPSHRCAP